MLLTIAPKNDNQKKSRIFTATLLGYGEVSKTVWQLASDDVIRPVWIALGGSDTELMPFVTNLRTGKAANMAEAPSYKSKSDTRIEMPKSAEYLWSYHKVALEGSVETLAFGCVAELCQFDASGVDPDGIRFVCLTPDWYVKSHPLPNEIVNRVVSSVGQYERQAVADHLTHMLRFTAMLNSRTDIPLIPDPVFSVRLYLSLLQAGVIAVPNMSVGWNDWRKNIRSSGALPMQMTAAAIDHKTMQEVASKVIQEHYHGTN